MMARVFTARCAVCICLPLLTWITFDTALFPPTVSHASGSVGPLEKAGCVISGFRRRVSELFALLGCYEAQNCSYVSTFRGNQTS